jgi:hypothetical protein
MDIQLWEAQHGLRQWNGHTAVLSTSTQEEEEEEEEEDIYVGMV